MEFRNVLVVGIYFLIIVGLVTTVTVGAKRAKRGPSRWSVAAFLFAFVILGWDLIPTLAMQKYYCARDAGSRVHKTMEQWNLENPGIRATLIANKLPGFARRDGEKHTVTFTLNQRITWVVSRSEPFFINVWRWDHELRDIGTNEVLAKAVDFSTGDGRIGGEPPLRFWLQREGCTNRNAIENSDFGRLKQQFLEGLTE